MPGHAWALSGRAWFYYDHVLPFGLRSAPFIFNSFADSIEWILQDTCHLDEVMHYLDDFLVVTGPSLALATAYRNHILKLLAYLSVPMAHEKVEGPSTQLVFLGIVLNTVTLSLRTFQITRYKISGRPCLEFLHAVLFPIGNSPP